MDTMLRPSRTWHNGDTGADVQQGPISKILFRLRPRVNLFYCLLLIHIPGILSITEEEAGVLACGHVRILHVPGHQGLINKGTAQPVFIKTEYLRECLASRVWPYMHQLRIMSLVKCWVGRLLCFAALRFPLSPPREPGGKTTLFCL